MPSLEEMEEERRILLALSCRLIYETEAVRYAMPVPVRGLGRAPAGTCLSLSVCGEPGGRTPDREDCGVVGERCVDVVTEGNLD